MHNELRKAKARCEYLEGLIRKYAAHVGNCEGVSFLEARYEGGWGGVDPDYQFSKEEWAETRKIAGEPDA
ncbi:MAG: hypothetical protein ACYSUC_12325 [Planctomycetota bacterium]|jgi:hypothetical protein